MLHGVFATLPVGKLEVRGIRMHGRAMIISVFPKIAAALMIACAAAPISATASSQAVVRDEAPEDVALKLLRASDLRVATVAFRLATASPELCLDRAPLTGLVLHDALQYSADYRSAATRLFALGDRPAVMEVVPGSPADRAGLKPNDTLVAINGTAVGASPRARKAPRASYDRLAEVLAELDHALAAGPVALDVVRNAKRLTIRVVPVTGCASRVQLLPDGDREAGADGRMISITTALADYTSSDDELAVVIGHEMAHNARRHRANLDAAGVSRGLFGHFGKDAASIRKTEREADYVGLYLMARAGFDITAAPTFWRRFGRATDLGIFSDPTHPRWRERERDLLTGIAEIDAKRARGDPLLPALPMRAASQ